MKKLVKKMLLGMCMCVGLMGCQKQETEELIKNSQTTEIKTDTTETSEIIENEEIVTEAVIENAAPAVLQEWQKEYCKVLLEILAKTDNTMECYGDSFSGDKFELVDINGDAIPELWVKNVIFFAGGEYQIGVSGIKTDTNQLILYEEYNSYEPIYVVNITDSGLEVEFIYWNDYDEETYHISYDEVYVGDPNNSTAISQEEYDALVAAHDSSNLRQMQGVDLTVDNIEAYLNIEFGGHDREFIELLLENGESFDHLEYAQIYLDDNDVPEYVVREKDYFFRIYIHDGETFHVLGDGSSNEERVHDFLAYGTHSSSYSYYEKQGVVSYFALGNYGDGGSTFYKLNDNYELEYYFDKGTVCEFDEEGEMIEKEYCYNFYEHESGVYEKYEAIHQQLGDEKDMVYEAEAMGYTNAIDLVIRNIGVRN